MTLRSTVVVLVPVTVKIPPACGAQECGFNSRAALLLRLSTRLIVTCIVLAAIFTLSKILMVTFLFKVTRLSKTRLALTRGRPK